MKKIPFCAVLLCGVLVMMASADVVAQDQNLTPPPDPRFKTDILIIVAHPDDESGIAGYIAKAVFDEHKRVSVVISNNGNAGQNLAGYEQDRSLAEIRQIEVREALASLGVHHVWFLRTSDTPAPDGQISNVLRSLETWGHGQALDEMVRLIRLTRPEVIITLLPYPVVGENHEDHQAAGVIATEAFDLAGDPTRFPEQLGAPDNRLWYGNLTEGLHPWQPKKLYYFSYATQLGFVKDKGPEYSMTAVSPSEHVPYGWFILKDISFQKTQYHIDTAKAIATGDLLKAFLTKDDSIAYRQAMTSVTFVLGKSLVGGAVTGDIFQGITSRPISFVPVNGYKPADKPADYTIEIGNPWAFYKIFWPAHDLTSLERLLPPQIGVGGGQEFPIPLILKNNSDEAVTIHLQAHLPEGWSVDSTKWFPKYQKPQSTYEVPSHGDYPLQIRLVAPQVTQSKWQKIAWTEDVNGQTFGTATLMVYVEGKH